MYRGENMKQRGFTLAELLAVIVVLGLIAVITIPAVTKTLVDSKTRLCEEQVANIEESARIWGSDHLFDLPDAGKTDTITIETLQKAGIIAPDLKDPKNSDQPIDPKTPITISVSTSNKVTYTVDYSCE